MEASTMNATEIRRDPWEEEVEARLPEGEGATVQELQADYLLEKLADEQAALDHLREFTDRRIQMIRDHAESERLKIMRRVEYLETRIRMCVPTDPEQFQRAYGKKSIRLPHGTLGYRSGREKVEVCDITRAVQWAKANGVEVIVSEQVHKPALADALKKTGEIPDPEECGFALVRAEDAFYVKVGG